jgi:hypothetical protein
VTGDLDREIARLDEILLTLHRSRGPAWVCIWVGVGALLLGLSQSQMLAAVLGAGIAVAGWLWKSTIDAKAERIGRERQALYRTRVH